MTQRVGDLVVGVGSGHGDDQAGWRLIDALAARDRVAAQLRKASVPHDMFDWLDECHHLHIVDACDSTGDLQRLDYPYLDKVVVCRLRSGSSHQISVENVVKLAESLGRLPPHVTVWAIPGQDFRPYAEVGDGCMRHVEQCADRIESELVLEKRVRYQ